MHAARGHGRAGISGFDFAKSPQREPPARKVWETVGSPTLLVIGSYRLGFEAAPHEGGTLLRVFIDYALPVEWPARCLGRLFGRYYAHWCIQRMAQDTARQFAAREQRR